LKIIVTGSEGFVGKHTVEALKNKGHTVVGFDHNIDEKLDIRNYDSLCDVIDRGDRILHLAAVARFDKSENNPQLAYSTNVGGTANVIKAAIEKQAEKVVHASTGSVYMPLRWYPVREDHPIQGNSHYGLSKAFAEQMYWYNKMPYIILRYGHIYGPGKLRHGAIGGFLNRMERGLKPVLFGGNQSNTFVYVKDIVQANLLALSSTSLGTYNIGSEEERTTEECFEILRRVTGYKGEFDYQPIRSVDAPRFYMTSAKAIRILGYRPQYTLEEGLEEMFHAGSGIKWQAGLN